MDRLSHPGTGSRVPATPPPDYAAGLAFHSLGHGTPVLLLHGLASSRGAFNPIFTELARRHRVIAVDLPGHGDSELPDRGEPLTPRAQAYALGAFPDALGLDKVHVVGNPWGWVALELAADGRALSVTGLCPAGLWRPIPNRSPLLEFNRHAAVAFGAVGEALMLIRPLRELVFSAALARPDKLDYGTRGRSGPSVPPSATTRPTTASSGLASNAPPTSPRRYPSRSPSAPRTSSCRPDRPSCATSPPTQSLGDHAARRACADVGRPDGDRCLDPIYHRRLIPTTMGDPVVQMRIWHVTAPPAAVLRVAAARLALRKQPGLRFVKVLGTGSGESFTVRDADWHRWALLTVFDDRPSANAFADASFDRSWRRIATETLRLDLRPLTSTGRWARRTPFDPPHPPQRWRGTVAALTRARIRPTNGNASRARATGRGRSGAASRPHPSLGNRRGAYRIARNLQHVAVQRCAERVRPAGQTHRRVIEQTRRTGWYAEELFARFAVLDAVGRLRRPTAGAVRDAVSRRLPWLLAGAAILVQIAWPLTTAGSTARVVATSLTVVLFAAASISHAAVTRGVRWGAAYAAIAIGIGLVVEVLGVHTGLPFSRYAYTDVLYPQVFNVPLVVPLAWAMMAYPALLVGQRLGRGALRRSSSAATRWRPGTCSWTRRWWRRTIGRGPQIPGRCRGGRIPRWNYLGWLLVSFVLIGLLTLLGDPMAPDAITDAASSGFGGIGVGIGGPSSSIGNASPTSQVLRAEGVPALLYAWTWVGGIVANAVFLHRPAVAMWGGLAMGAVAIPYLWKAAQRGRRLARARNRPPSARRRPRSGWATGVNPLAAAVTSGLRNPHHDGGRGLVSGTTVARSVVGGGTAVSLTTLLITVRNLRLLQQPSPGVQSRTDTPRRGCLCCCLCATRRIGPGHVWRHCWPSWRTGRSMNC